MNIHIKSIVSAFAFSFLLYSKSMGINLLLVALITVTLLTIVQEHTKKPSLFAFAYVFTALMVFLDPTNFKVFIHFMAFFVYIGKNIAPRNSLYLSWFIGVVNMIIASLYHLNSYLKNPEQQKKSVSPTLLNAIKGIFAALILLVAFSLLYKTANPVFNTILSNINLEFLSLPWLFFTLMGYLIFLHILRPYFPEKLIVLDSAQKNELAKPDLPFSSAYQLKLVGEHTLSSIIFGALNILLVFFLITDLIYITELNSISKLAYSQSVHQGIYALIFSIICAIAIILYFFRGDLNFLEKNNTLKTLSYIWISLNLILVASTWYKNYLYVDALGLTYKRIGVFIYLLLVVTGLCTTYIKVSKTKGFIYLVRTNLALLFTFLFLSSIVPWDKAITYYNLNTITNPDLKYLVYLGNTNSTQLQAYVNQNENENTLKFKESIRRKNANLLKSLDQQSWQEYSIYQFKRD